MIDMTKQYTYNGKPVRIYADGSDTFFGSIHFAYKDKGKWFGKFNGARSDLEEVWQPKEGEWCFFWDTLSNGCYVRKLEYTTKDGYVDSNNIAWSNCAKFTGTLPEAFKGL